MSKQGYRVENRWGDKPWWVVYHFSDDRAKVISRHSSHPAATKALKAAKLDRVQQEEGK